MKKKLFSLALALALCLGLTVPAFAAELKIIEVPEIGRASCRARVCQYV